MASFVDYPNKNGRIYVYYNESSWNSDTQKPDTKRICVGKRNPDTGELIPNKAYDALLSQGSLTVSENGSLKIDLDRAKEQKAKSGAAAAVTTIGPLLLCEKAAVGVGIKAALITIFKEEWDKILTCAYFLICEGKALSRIEPWSVVNKTPYGSRITSRQVSELLKSLDRTRQFSFFKLWMYMLKTDGYFALDVTSVSSYSTQNEYVRYGYNRDKEDLPQINLCMLIDEKRRVPAYFEQLPGSIGDVSTLNNIVKTLHGLGAEKIHFVTDKGFYSESNINNLYASRHRFTIGVSFVAKWAQELVSESRDSIETLENYHRFGVDERPLYMMCSTSKWNGHRCYKHIYYDSKKAVDDRIAAMDKLSIYKEELESGNTVEKHKKYYDEFFKVTETPKGGRRVIVLEDKVRKHIDSTAGYFVMLSNDIKDPLAALRVYRAKDAVEKGFDDLKNSLDMNRLRVHSADSMSGRLFIQFVALAIMAELRNIMDDSGLSASHSLTDVFDEMKLLQQVSITNKAKPFFTKATKLQQLILEAFEIPGHSYV